MIKKMVLLIITLQIIFFFFQDLVEDQVVQRAPEQEIPALPPNDDQDEPGAAPEGEVVLLGPNQEQNHGQDAAVAHRGKIFFFVKIYFSRY